MRIAARGQKRVYARLRRASARPWRCGRVAVADRWSC